MRIDVLRIGAFYRIDAYKRKLPHWALALNSILPVQSCLGRLTWKSSIGNHFLKSPSYSSVSEIEFTIFKIWEDPYLSFVSH